MATRRFLMRPRLLLVTGALLAGAVTGVFLLSSVLSSKAQRPDLQQNADFLKRGRPDIALCISDYTTSPADQADLVSRLKDATADNKASLWKDTFLASERLRVESPCPAGPRVSETTTFV